LEVVFRGRLGLRVKLRRDDIGSLDGTAVDRRYVLEDHARLELEDNPQSFGLLQAFRRFHDDLVLADEAR
jgi:hypothetical protein